ncbi:uncharacterized protein STEHIDRAFT_172818 [Stereum hirsutum FP-91666 SS1]|uniref:WD40 repeat-like protein n=1 Tax=Stereum hirsutum (strain FP-91666) TaxID=721885 RepID=R7RZ88_STEHR|nr:uncharacterized protein STEHIDRAFT_172818 [Stereum hirsutum FP-91666 SS1]EIM80148.1 hypothetical protein STEHIDRAFT_172818 [Stereum hirsutum FP-91666 SS1]
MVERWGGCCAVGGDDVISIFDFGSQSGGEGRNYGKGKARETNERPREMVPIVIEIPSSKDAEPSERAIKSITWAFTKEQPSSPLLVYARKSRVYVLDLKEHLSGRSNWLRFLKGHGGLITSVQTSPDRPFLILTTSRDLSSRIWDLSPIPAPHPGPEPPLAPPTTSTTATASTTTTTHQRTRELRPRNNIINPNALNRKNQSGTKTAGGSLSGAGARREGGERWGGVDMERAFPGRCWRVLAGGLPAGHLGGVLCAAWHPRLPVVATCGVDRTVKIWNLNLPPDEETGEPIFSTSYLHSARILSVSWLHDDILATHSSPTQIQDLSNTDPDRKSDEPMKLIRIPGELIIWKWTSMHRFFPGRDSAGDDVGSKRPEAQRQETGDSEMEVEDELNGEGGGGKEGHQAASNGNGKGRGKEYQMVLRGGERDYKDSVSFTKLATLSLPLSSPSSLNLTTYTHTAPHSPVPPLFLIPFSEPHPSPPSLSTGTGTPMTAQASAKPTTTTIGSIRLIPAWALHVHKLRRIILPNREREASGEMEGVLNDMTKQTGKMRLASASASTSRETSAAVDGARAGSRSASTAANTVRGGSSVAPGNGRPWNQGNGWDLKWELSSWAGRTGVGVNGEEGREALRIEGVSVGLGGDVVVAVGEEGMRIWTKVK